MSTHFDALETQEHSQRQRQLFARLPQFLARAAAAAPGWALRLDGIDPASVTSRESLARIPVLRKPELMEAQAANPPFGGLADHSLLDGARYFMSPGPVWEPHAAGEADSWNCARAFHAAGIGPGDIVHNALSYHMTPGGFILDEGARAVGAKVFPGGVGNTAQQVEAAHWLKPTAYAGTPDFLKTMLENAAETGRDLSSIRKALVSGGALFPSLREEYRMRGIAVMQCYATADLGVIAYETQVDGNPLPGMVVSENIILEIVRPGTDDSVEPGEVGEIVVTNFNAAYPLIRFGTGDLSALIAEPSPCGRTNLRIKGWMGRADQRTKVKGMFVDPKQIDLVVKAIPAIVRARLVVTRDGDADAMTLLIEPRAGQDPDPEAIAAVLATHTRLKGRVEITSGLPNDGKIIDDRRDYSK